jgi:transposase
MDDSRCREFFSQPAQPYHRQYESLRAVFLEGSSQKEVADRFGYSYSSLRQLVYEFRRDCHRTAGGSPFFASRRSGGRPQAPRSRQRRKPTTRKRRR